MPSACHWKRRRPPMRSSEEWIPHQPQTLSSSLGPNKSNQFEPCSVSLIQAACLPAQGNKKQEHSLPWAGRLSKVRTEKIPQVSLPLPNRLERMKERTSGPNGLGGTWWGWEAILSTPYWLISGAKGRVCFHPHHGAQFTY